MNSTIYSSQDQNNIFLVIDECHCVVQWRENFRIKYKDIHQLRCHQLRCLLPHFNFMCLIATVFVSMQFEISHNLHLGQPIIIVGPLNRPNIFLAAKDASSYSCGLDSEDRFR